MNNHQTFEILNFNYIIHFKRDNVRTGGIAFYQNTSYMANILKPNMDITMTNIYDLNSRYISFGEICSALGKMENSVEIVMIINNISQN